MNRVTGLSDNLLMLKLGEACSRASVRKDVGDQIDRGLILLNELESEGFLVFIPYSPHSPTSKAIEKEGEM